MDQKVADSTTQSPPSPIYTPPSPTYKAPRHVDFECSSQQSPQSTVYYYSSSEESEPPSPAHHPLWERSPTPFPDEYDPFSDALSAPPKLETKESWQPSKDLPSKDNASTDKQPTPFPFYGSVLEKMRPLSLEDDLTFESLLNPCSDLYSNLYGKWKRTIEDFTDFTDFTDLKLPVFDEKEITRYYSSANSSANSIKVSIGKSEWAVWNEEEEVFEEYYAPADELPAPVPEWKTIWAESRNHENEAEHPQAYLQKFQIGPYWIHLTKDFKMNWKWLRFIERVLDSVIVPKVYENYSKMGPDGSLFYILITEDMNKRLARLRHDIEKGDAKPDSAVLFL